jgi:hypothetical protein
MPDVVIGAAGADFAHCCDHLRNDDGWRGIGWINDESDAFSRYTGRFSGIIAIGIAGSVIVKLMEVIRDDF